MERPVQRVSIDITDSNIDPVASIAPAAALAAVRERTGYGERPLDATPITVFMLVYLAYALRVFLRMGWLPVGVALAAFLYLSSATADLQCSTALSRIAEPCFNGSLGYLPALATLPTTRDLQDANAALAADAFRFVPPKGADLLEQ